tara:strand:- start:415 stop:876 length:462 start_codon:yes stop_codon:yes gene_type:complete
MGILSVIGNLLGIGKGYLENRARLKQAKSDQEFEITKAETGARVGRIKSETEGDLNIDMITARNKKYTFKDEILTYLFLMPVVVATIVPFFQAMSVDGSWLELNVYFKESYMTLDLLPQWYKWVLGAVVVDVLGFRSFARKLVEMYINSKKVS